MWRDPLGNEIRLTQQCWAGHILARHPVMRRFKKRVAETIYAPDFIFQSRAAEESRLYYRQYQKPFGRHYVLVVVGGDNYVQAAFPVYNLRKGKNLLWPRN